MVNQMIFDIGTESGLNLFNQFLAALLEYNKTAEEDFNDIHIKPEDGDLIKLEWIQVPYSQEWGGAFKFVDDDEEVLKHVDLPDGSYDYAVDDEDAERIRNNWITTHPNWKRTFYGFWYEEDTKDIEEEPEEINLSAEAGNDKE